MGAYIGQVVQKLSWTEGMVGTKVRLVLEGPNVDVEFRYGVFLSVPFP